jgi:hypothetical protein
MGCKKPTFASGKASANTGGQTQKATSGTASG